MKYALVVAALVLSATAVEAAPRRRGKASSGAAAAGANAAAAVCKPTITCKVGGEPAFVIPRKAPPNVGSDGKLHCRYEVDRAGKKWVTTRRARCGQVPVTQCKNITKALMRVRSASVAYMTATPRDGKCLVMPRVSLKQK